MSAIGAGGMGEVYRARDATLDRDVAIKVLPELFAADPERLARFAREARALASLNHPNIAQIYGVEESGPTHGLVMEFVDGKDLSEIIAQHKYSAPAAVAPSASASRGMASSGGAAERATSLRSSGGGAPGAMSVQDALPIARQIADALEYAHEQGIVHRDLKPANVKVREDGTVKVLDFGLAKVVDPATSMTDAMSSPTLTARATSLGTIIGTAAYMSPEQAKGRAVDKRADVWAFGAVLYEMLTGRRAFDGEDVTDTLTAVLRDTPDWSALPQSVTPRLRRLIERCLERDIRQRLRDIGEARIELSKIESGAPDTASIRIVTPTEVPRRRGLGVATVAGLAITAALVTVAVTWSLRSAAPPPSPIRFTISLPTGIHLNGTSRSVLTVSPDGRLIAYTANQPSGLYLRGIDSFNSTLIKGTEEHVVLGPVFSPDSRSIVYWASLEQALQKVSIDGGAPVTLCQTELPSGLSWGDAGIVFSNQEGVFKVSPDDGGAPVQLVKTSPSTFIFSPRLLPGGKALLYTEAAASGGTERWDAGRIMVQPLSGQPKVIIDRASDARYVAGGYIIFARSGLLYAAAFDVGTLTVTSDAVPVVEGVMRGIGTFGSGTINLSVSDNGVLAYVPGPLSPIAANMQIARFDLTGGGTQAIPLPPGPYQTPRVSPDGRRIAFIVDDSRDADVWVYDIGTDRAPRRLTFGGNNRSPVWSPDSARIAYRSDRDGGMSIYWQTADGAGAAERLTPATKGTVDWPDAFSPDGRLLLFDRVIDGRMTLWQVSIGDRKESPVGAIHSTELTGAVFSPDGKWIAYAARESGQKNALMVGTFPPSAAKYQVSLPNEDGHHPVWSADGNDLFYTPGPGNRIAHVAVTRGPAFGFGSPTALNRLFINTAGSADRPYDIMPDGKQFLGVTDVTTDPARTDSINVVVNWFAELRAKVGK
ncbi:MAG: protein kinase domain-containing protein [Vicinamibacterales bacterium]